MLRECLVPASGLYGFLSIHDHAAQAALQQAAQRPPSPAWKKILTDLAGMIRSERRLLHQQLAETHCLYLRGPRRFVDADQPQTGARLLYLMNCGVTRVALLQVLSAPRDLDPTPDEGRADHPPAHYRLPLPVGVPEWAPEYLPAHALVRWFLEELLEATAVEQNYASRDLFTRLIAYPLAALVLALRPELDLIAGDLTDTDAP